MIFFSSFHYQNYKKLADKTTLNHKKYCEKNGYDFWPHRINDSLDDKSGYDILCIAGKMNAIIIFDFLRQMNSNDYLFTIGCDAVITNTDIKLEDIIDQYKSDIICGSDPAGINTSQLLIKNTEQTRQYFKDMLKYIESGGEHDQRYMWDNRREFMFETNQHVMNSYDCVARLEGENHPSNWQEGDFLVHLAGLTLEQRMSRIDYWLGKVK